MSPKQKTPRIVAELGRPETPAETAARKAQDTKNYRERKTVNNLVLSLLVTVGMVLVIFLAVPRGNFNAADHSQDVPALAAAAQDSAGMALIAPELPNTWRANRAELRHSAADKVTFWYAGYVTPSDNYAAFAQAKNANATWVAGQLENQTATGTERIAGVDWTVYDHSDRGKDGTNVSFGLEAVIGETTVLVFGTDTPDTIRELATAVVASERALASAQ